MPAMLAIDLPPAFLAGVGIPLLATARIVNELGEPVHVAGVPVQLTTSLGGLTGTTLRHTDAGGVVAFPGVAPTAAGLQFWRVQSAGWYYADTAPFVVEPVPSGWTVWYGGRPWPTIRGGRYGPHYRNVYDLWSAGAGSPLVVHIHGGGWFSGDRRQADATVVRYLAAGISVATIDYTFLQESQTSPPVEAAYRDARLFLAYARQNASAWGIDPDRIALAGGSAGGCTALALAATDPEIVTVAVNTAQTTLDPALASQCVPGWSYGHLAFGYSTYAAFCAACPDTTAYSPHDLAHAAMPPVYLRYYDGADATHDVRLGELLAGRLVALGVPCELVGPGHAGTHADEVAYLIDALT